MIDSSRVIYGLPSRQLKALHNAFTAYVADLELRKCLVQRTPDALAGFGFKEKSPQYPPATSYSASRVFLIDHSHLSHALGDCQSAPIFGAVARAGALDDAPTTVNGCPDQ